jgi:hypothetical protein
MDKTRMVFVLTFVLFFNSFSPFGQANIQTVEFQKIFEVPGSIIGIITNVSIPVMLVNEFMGLNSAENKQKQNIPDSKKRERPVQQNEFAFTGNSSLEQTVKKVEMKANLPFFGEARDIYNTVLKFTNGMSPGPGPGTLVIALLLLAYLVLLYRRKALPVKYGKLFLENLNPALKKAGFFICFLKERTCSFNRFMFFVYFNTFPTPACDIARE